MFKIYKHIKLDDLIEEMNNREHSETTIGEKPHFEAKTFLDGLWIHQNGSDDFSCPVHIPENNWEIEEKQEMYTIYDNMRTFYPVMIWTLLDLGCSWKETVYIDVPWYW